MNSRNIWRYQRGSQKMTYNTIEKKKTDKEKKNTTKTS